MYPIHKAPKDKYIKLKPVSKSEAMAIKEQMIANNYSVVCGLCYTAKYQYLGSVEAYANNEFEVSYNVRALWIEHHYDEYGPYAALYYVGFDYKHFKSQSF